MLFFFKSYNLIMFCVYQILHSEAMLHRGDCSAIKLQKGIMNINVGACSGQSHYSHYSSYTTASEEGLLLTWAAHAVNSNNISLLL